VLRAGSLALDPATRQCTLDDEVVELTPREFSVLEQLLRHGGDVVPRAALLNDVWGADYAGDPKVVDVYIRYLRRKLDERVGRPIIRTIRGVGYQIPGGAR
jgi:DNA-binding response OmpR family regulator